MPDRSLFTFAVVAAAVTHVTAAAATADAPAIGPCTITVAVRDASGRPVAGSIVAIAGTAERTGATTLAGIVTFAAVPAGRYVVRARTPDGRSNEESVVVTAPRPASEGSGRHADVRFVALQLVASELGAELADRSATTASLVPGDPAPAVAIAVVPFAEVSSLRGAGGIRTAGGDLRGLFERIDGVPLPDALRGSLVLARDPALVSAFTLGIGAAALSRPDPGTGGLLALQTGPAAAAAGLAARAGEGARGLDASLDAGERLGPLTAGARLGAAAPAIRARSLEARLQLSPETNLEAAAYRFDDGGCLATGGCSVSVRSAGLTTSLGAARVGLRVYDSAFGAAVAPVDDRLHGVAFTYDGTLAQAGFALTYLRDAEEARYAGGSQAARRATALGLRSAYALSPAMKVEVVESRRSGTLIGTRDDTSATLAVDLPSPWALRLTTATGTEPAPLDLVAGATAATAPSLATPATALSRSASLARTTATATLAVDVFDLRERNRFAAQSDEAATGLAARYATTRSRGLGVDLSAALTRIRRFGTATPERDPATTPLAAALGLATATESGAALRARAAVTLRTPGGIEAALGATYFDAPNALTPTALVVSDLSLRLLLGRAGAPFALRLRGYEVAGGRLRPAPAVFGPRAAGTRADLELTLEAATGRMR